MHERQEPSFSPTSKQKANDSSWENDAAYHSGKNKSSSPEGGYRRYTPPPQTGISLSAKITLGAVVALACGMVLWYTVLSPPQEILKDVPLITPPDTPYKTHPENPGGTHVPHQEVLVYNRIQPKGKAIDENIMLEDTDDLSQEEIDTLLAPETFPQHTPPQLSARQSLDSDNSSNEPLPGNQPDSFVRQDMMEGLPEPDIVSPEAVSQDLSSSDGLLDSFAQEEPTESDPYTQKNSQITPHTQPIEVRSLEAQMSGRQKAASNVANKNASATSGAYAPRQQNWEESTPAKKMPTALPLKENTKTTSSLSKSYRVQVASLTSKASADGEHKRLSAKFPKELGGKTSEAIRVDLGPKGIRYRLLLGPYKTKESAQAACRALAKGNVGCLVVKPSL